MVGVKDLFELETPATREPNIGIIVSFKTTMGFSGLGDKSYLVVDLNEPSKGNLGICGANSSNGHMFLIVNLPKQMLHHFVHYLDKEKFFQISIEVGYWTKKQTLFLEPRVEKCAGS
jgi:hypothetical protein